MPQLLSKDPGDFDNRVIDWELLRLVGLPVQSFPDVIDLSESLFLRPYSLACLASIGERSGKVCKLVLPQDTACSLHLQRSGLTRWFSGVAVPHLQSRSTNVVIEQLLTKPGSAAEQVVDLLLESQSLSTGEARSMKDHLDEILLNAMCHSGSQFGCFVSGQLFPKKYWLELAVVDLGCSIPVHLRTNPKHASRLQHEELLVLATENGVTGTVLKNAWGGQNSGAGLFELRNFCESGRGELAIVSGSAIATFKPNQGPKTSSLTHAFPGCLVNIRFYLNQSANVSVNSGTMW